MKNYILNRKIFFIIFICICFSSCTMEPIVADQDELGVSTEVDMQTLINGAYVNMVSHYYMGRSYIIAGDVMADNTFSSARTNRFSSMSRMDLKPVDTDNDKSVDRIWQNAYAVIGQANIVINADFDAIQEEDNTADIDNMYHLLGEAYALRAMAHFDLLRFYGQLNLDNGEEFGIPYVKEFKGEEGTNVSRESIDDNRQNIYNDLEQAIENMKEGKNSKFAKDRSNMTLDAVYTLQSRVGVYFGSSEDYEIAKKAVLNVYGKYPLTTASDYVDYWEDSSIGSESIFELERSTNNNDGSSSLAQIFRGDVYGDIEVFKNIVNDAEFGDNDIRSSKAMIDFEGNKLRNMGKYPHMGEQLGSDNIKVFRYAEVVLNYAEAILKDDKNKALALLNEVANARHGSNYNTANLDNILKERRKEFMFEGFRFHDLKRTKQDIRQIDPGAPNGHGLVPAGDNRFAMPIPQHDDDSNSQIVQNPGY